MNTLRRFLFIVILTAFINSVSAKPVTVTLETQAGPIEIDVLIDQAPVSGASFLAHVDAGLLNDGGFYRTVYPENDNGSPKISVIQGGMLPDKEGLPPVAHETTKQTGILHEDGIVSLARGAVGTGSGSAFFICIGDQPSLDQGGGRASSGDGQGFAAFARVTQGMEVVHKIHRSKTKTDRKDSYTAGQIIDPPVRILKAFRKSPPAAR